MSPQRLHTREDPAVSTASDVLAAPRCPGAVSPRAWLIAAACLAAAGAQAQIDGVSVGMGVRVPLGAQQPPRLRDAAGEAALRDGRGEVQMALSFSTRSATSDLRSSLALRMSLGGATAITLRPRGGGRVLLQLNSQW